MADTAASEAGRALVSARWRGQVISRAIATIATRQDELTGEQLADLRAIAALDEQEAASDE